MQIKCGSCGGDSNTGSLQSSPELSLVPQSPGWPHVTSARGQNKAQHQKQAQSSSLVRQAPETAEHPIFCSCWKSPGSRGVFSLLTVQFAHPVPKTGGVAAAQATVGALLLSQAFGHPLPTCHNHSKAQRPLCTAGFVFTGHLEQSQKTAQGVIAAQDSGMMFPFYGKLIALHPSQEVLDEEDREFPRITECSGLEILLSTPPCQELQEVWPR